MKKHKNYAKLKLKVDKKNCIDILLGYNYYDYQTKKEVEISNSSTLIILEYRSGFSNVYQSITFVVSEFEKYCEVIIYESKTTTSLSNLLCVRKEVERIKCETTTILYGNMNVYREVMGRKEV